MAVRDKLNIPPVVAPERITITVGVHADDGGGAHANDTDDALTVADVARFHEFGVGPFTVVTGFGADGGASGYEHPGIPQRSFIRAWFDESQDFIKETMHSQMKQVMAGKLTADKAMARIALAFENSVKVRIARGIGPPLAESTKAAKGSSKPLINTGQLRGAIRGRGTLGGNQ